MYNNLSFANQRGATLGFYNNVANAASTLYLPMVATNKATRYESWITIDLNG